MMSDRSPSASLKWVEGLQFVAQSTPSGPAIILDGSPDHGGSGGGPSPMAALLMSLAGCTGMDVISIMQKKRQRVRAFHVNVYAERAAEHPKRYTRIELEYVFEGVGLSQRAAERSVELSQTKYCGVTASLNSEIVASVVIHEVEA